MKKYCINLVNRADRAKHFFTNVGVEDAELFKAYDGSKMGYIPLDELGIKPDHKWLDPILKRRLTKGEMGCLASHVDLWNKCIKLDKPVMILEDDIIVHSTFNEPEIEAIIDEGCDFLYLGHREMDPDNTVDLNDKLVVPSFAYLTHAYVITPFACQMLLEGLKFWGGIPADELIPRCYNKIRVAAYKEDRISQVNRNELGSDIEPVGDEDYLPFKNVHLFTVATEKAKAYRLLDSAAHVGSNVILVGEGRSSFDMSFTGGGIKLNLMREELKDYDDDDLMIFCDGYDTFLTMDVEAIQERFLSFNSDIVFSAEKICWPDEKLSDLYPKVETAYRYLNSGTYVGRIGAIKRLLQTPLADSDDDQRYMTKKFLSGNFDIKLDTECYIFQTNTDSCIYQNGQLYNPETYCYPSVYHGNGGAAVEKVMDNYYDQFMGTKPTIPFISKNIDFITTGVVKQLDTDMYSATLLSPSMCQYLIEASDKHNGWKKLEGDKFPAQEIRIGELNLWEDFASIWDEYIGPLYESLWFPTEHYGLRDAFVMRYAIDTQKELPTHIDASLVTGSVRLNDDYTGAELWFPRQKISNKSVPIGEMLLFPGQVTHGHECTELLSGVKYSLTMWSQRYPQDII